MKRPPHGPCHVLVGLPGRVAVLDVAAEGRPPVAGSLEERTLAAMATAQRNAWLALERYEFTRFGQQADRWALLNSVIASRRPNPFRELVQMARAECEIKGHKPKGDT